MTSAPDLQRWVRWCVEDSRLFADDDAVFAASLAEGHPNVTLIVGDNASGKSLLFRLLAEVLRKETKAFVPTLSIRERSGAGLFEGARMRQAFMYGDESDQSTGAVSVKVIASGFANLDREQGSVLALDEPEMGLSEGYSYALGKYVGEQALAVPAVCGGVFVVTHSRPFARGLRSGLGATPTFVSTRVAGATGWETFDQWLDGTDERTVEDLLALPETGLNRFRQVNKLLKG